MDKKALILVVDDNSGCRELLVGIVELHGFQVIAATCGREAVDLAIAFQPELILMDLSMPGMNGYETTLAIHAHPRGRKIPVVAVSADCVDYTYVSRALESGFLACLSKPWEEPALLETVKKILARGLKPARALIIVEKRRDRVSRPGARRLRRAA